MMPALFYLVVAINLGHLFWTWWDFRQFLTRLAATEGVTRRRFESDRSLRLRMHAAMHANCERVVLAAMTSRLDELAAGWRQ